MHLVTLSVGGVKVKSLALGFRGNFNNFPEWVYLMVYLVKCNFILSTILSKDKALK